MPDLFPSLIAFEIGFPLNSGLVLQTIVAGETADQ
jgi:hypothetical protein